MVLTLNINDIYEINSLSHFTGLISRPCTFNSTSLGISLFPKSIFF